MAARVPKRPSLLCSRTSVIQCVKQPKANRKLSSSSLAQSVFQKELPRNATQHKVFSGIQPTGIPHLGNYLGALRQWRQLQDEGTKMSCIYCIVDLHALTTVNPQEAHVLKRHRRETLASLLAIGLDPDKSCIYFQSTVHHHSELMWILSCHASMGYLSRMTQWKSKLSLADDASITTSSEGKNLKLGLFSYPVLQAADILLHQTTIVPVGEDQRQHIEFARELANSFNHLYGDMFQPPETHISPAKRVMSLLDPTKKMSKSDPAILSRILLSDPEATISAKIKGARTDSIPGITYDPINRPGVSNLIEILAHLQADRGPTCEELAQDMKDVSLGALKERVATEINTVLAPIRERLEETLVEDIRSPEALDRIIKLGQKRASSHGGKTLIKVRHALGIST